MSKRTSFDFSTHELKVIQHDGVLIHLFKKPDSIHGNIKFINTCGIMAVTGDLGNWIFCREFHPSADGHADAGYWDGKLQISSKQMPKAYDADETTERINDFKKEFKDNYGRKMNPEEKDWIEKLEENVEDEFEYKIVAYRETPGSIDYESVPYGEKRHFWLDAVYDGFDAMCALLKQEAVEAS